MNRVPCVRVVRVGVEVRGGSRLAWGVGRATRTRESARLLFGVGGCEANRQCVEKKRYDSKALDSWV